MSYYDSSSYLSSIRKIAKDMPTAPASVLVTGATGLIGSCMIDVLCTANSQYGCNYSIYAIGRSMQRLKDRFSDSNCSSLNLIEHDVCDELTISDDMDYIIHAASNADPRSYALYPCETLLTNIYGTSNIINYCKKHPNTRVLLTSTFEVYGKLDGNDDYTENDYGIVDLNLIRSSYPESKRCAELLIKCGEQEYGIDGVIARLCSIYGPTMLKDDSKAHAQFIRNGISGNNIVLKSEGKQRRTYCYVMDAVSALFYILFNGKKGETYNVANSSSVASIAEVAASVAEICGTSVVFDVPDAVESKGFSLPQNCILDTAKLEQLGWTGSYSLSQGIEDTIKIMREIS